MSFELDFAALKRLRVGGFADTAAFLSMAAGGLATNPAVTGSVGHLAATLAGAGMAAGGGAWIAERAMQLTSGRVFRSSLKINSAEVPLVPRGEGMSIGFCTDTGKELVIPWEDWMRHNFIVGQSGVGKTVAGEWIMFQQILRGGGLLWIDGKLDGDNLANLRAMCAWAGREDDLLVVNPGNPALSNTYNPILYGDADEVASRILSLIPSASNNPGADYFRQSANQAVTTLVSAIQRTGRAYNFIDLTILLQNQRALAWLESLVPGSSSERKALSIFLEQFKSVSKDGLATIDLKKIRDVFGGVSGRMHGFGSGNFGQITSSYAPEVDLFDVMRNNKILYVMLPTMGKQEAASNFGKMTVGDFRTAVSWIQALPKDQRPWPPFLGFFDEAGSYITDAFSRIFEQARSAHLSMLPAVQTMANLEAISPELREMVIGNTWTKMAFKIGTNDTGEMLADLIGKERRVANTLSVSGGTGQSKTPKALSTTVGQSASASVGFVEREDEEYKVSPDDLRMLKKGECVVTVGGADVYHVAIPRLQFTDKFKESLGPLRLNRARSRFVSGLDLFRDVDKWLSGSGD